MLKERGYRVTGSDHGIYPPMSDVLAQAGICGDVGLSRP